MFQPYRDILERCGEPLWYDEGGVPRYAPFHPTLCSDIYATSAILVQVACQNCRETFYVATAGRLGVYRPQPTQGQAIFYGDAPYHEYVGGGMCSGCTMTVDNLRVMQCWHRVDGEWDRMSRYEVELEER